MDKEYIIDELNDIYADLEDLVDMCEDIMDIPIGDINEHIWGKQITSTKRQNGLVDYIKELQERIDNLQELISNSDDDEGE